MLMVVDDQRVVRPEEQGEQRPVPEAQNGSEHLQTSFMMLVLFYSSIYMLDEQEADKKRHQTETSRILLILRPSLL